jgi:hypothetical protein
MWLPTPIYKRVPQFWLLLGLLFMSSGTYLGFDFELTFLYFYTGFACIAWSLWIFVQRYRNRHAPQCTEANAEQLQQEAENSSEPHANLDAHA